MRTQAKHTQARHTQARHNGSSNDSWLKGSAQFTGTLILDGQLRVEKLSFVSMKPAFPTQRDYVRPKEEQYKTYQPSIAFSLPLVPMQVGTSHSNWRFGIAGYSRAYERVPKMF